MFREVDEWAFRHPWRWNAIASALISLLWLLFGYPPLLAAVIFTLCFALGGLNGSRGPGRRRLERRIARRYPSNSS